GPFHLDGGARHRRQVRGRPSLRPPGERLPALDADVVVAVEDLLSRGFRGRKSGLDRKERRGAEKAPAGEDEDSLATAHDQPPDQITALGAVPVEDTRRGTAC